VVGPEFKRSAAQSANCSNASETDRLFLVAPDDATAVSGRSNDGSSRKATKQRLRLFMSRFLSRER